MNKPAHSKLAEVGLLTCLIIGVCVPHINLSFFTSYQFLFDFSSRVLLLISFVLSGILLTRWGQNKRIFNYTDILILLFFAFNFALSFIQDSNSTEIFMILLPLLLFFSIKNYLHFVSTERSVALLMWILLFTVYIEIFYMVVQYFKIIKNFNHLFNVGGASGHPGYTAGSLSIILLIIAANRNSIAKRNILNIAYAIALCLVLIFSIYNSARASIIVLFLTLVIELRPVLQKVSRKILVRSMPVFLLLIMAVGVYLFFLKKDSSYGRLFIWKNSIALIKEKPWLGYGGLGTFQSAYNKYQMEYFMSGKGTETEKHIAEYIILAYNDFLEVAVETGLIGLLVFSSIMLFFLVRSFKSEFTMNDNRLHIFIPLIGFITYMFCWSIFWEIPYSTLFVVLIAYYNSNIE